MQKLPVTVTPSPANTIQSHLKELGWDYDRYTFEMASPDHEYCVDLSGDYGVIWVLKRFCDSDIDGVAVPRWKDLDVEGDTLEELRRVLEMRGVKI